MAINGKDLMDAMENDFGIVNVRKFGATGDGKTDDTAAFVAAKKEVIRLISVFAQNPDARRGNVTLYVPPGTYVIKQGKALMDDTVNPTTMGFSVIGAGRMISRIVFDPSTTGQYLFYNRDGWNQMHIADIEFYSPNGGNHFFYSYSSGRSHNLECERCHWGGKWGYGFRLEGTNTNSEMAWYRCGFSGEWTTALSIPATASDQFVNYDFISCFFEVAKGDFIDVQKGGSINILGGSFLYYPNSPKGYGGTLFKLGVGGGVHNGGAARFLCIGARVELTTADSKMLNCEWPIGLVMFQNVDNSTQAFQADKSWVNVRFNANGDSYPNIVFDNCSLQGRHQYEYNFASFQRAERIVYRNCTIFQYDTPDPFISLVNVSGFNDGGVPQISFERCNGAPGTTQGKYLFDTELNWSRTTSGAAVKKIASINTANDSLPYGQYPTEDLYLPLGAIITRVMFYMAPGTVASAFKGWNFTVRTSESKPTVLLSADPVGGDTRKGFQSQQELFFVCDTEEKRHLTLVASSGVNQIKKGYCLIEYIG